MIEIAKDFVGANVELVDIIGNEVILKNELRDTLEDWFYWAFCVKNAGGKTLRFRFDEKLRVGYYGAAVSCDLEKWEWTYSKTAGKEEFTYTFAQNENCVYFAHNMLYHPARFLRFAKQKGIEVKELCKAKNNDSVPYVTIGKGEKSIVLTARHHSCESTGSYVLEGVLDELSRELPSDYSVFCVPFMDYDGVVAGDQGKSRKPHDHNRDYGENEPAIYETVAKVRNYADTHEVVFGFDFHSPWHYGGDNDYVFIPKKSVEKLPEINHFAELLEKSMNENAMQYVRGHDVEPNTKWNKVGSPCFGTYMLNKKSCLVAFTLETAYFGTDNNKFSQDKAVDTGRCFAKALRKYIYEQ